MFKQIVDDFWKSLRRRCKPFELFVRDAVATALGGFGMFLMAMADLTEGFGKSLMLLFGAAFLVLSVSIAKWTREERMKME